MTFHELKLSRVLTDAVVAMGFDAPTPIQKQAIPVILEGRDLLAGAETGSGKTAAFLLPIMERLLRAERGRTRALAVVPTRELAGQVAEHFEALSGKSGLTCAAVFGGVGMGPQETAFRKGVDFIIATPGRLLDHMQNGYAKLPHVEYLVLDEADRMLDMGFLPDIRRILKAVPARRQTLLFSATLPKPIVELSREFLNDPAAINIDREPRPAHGITHAVYPVPNRLKPELLLALLNGPIPGTAIVFTRTKHRADKVAKFLMKNGVAAERIHGNRSQNQRTLALSGFKSGTFRVLVATDIAARGIDIEALGCVVNFDIPNIPEDYVHRVGRTARAEATGDAFSLVSPEEAQDFAAIERILGLKLPRTTVPGFNYDQIPAMPETARDRQGMRKRALLAGRSEGSGQPARSAGRTGRDGNTAAKNGANRPDRTRRGDGPVKPGTDTGRTAAGGQDPKRSETRRRPEGRNAAERSGGTAPERAASGRPQQSSRVQHTSQSQPGSRPQQGAGQQNGARQRHGDKRPAAGKPGSRDLPEYAAIRSPSFKKVRSAVDNLVKGLDDGPFSVPEESGQKNGSRESSRNDRTARPNGGKSGRPR
jgi:ATP-dependent RNA helicase RhlE